MRESKFYQYLQEKAARETTCKNTLAALKVKFPADAVSDLTPTIQNIEDLQQLEQLFLAAVQAQSLEAFARMLHE